MPQSEDLYIANLAFLLDYDEGYTKDEIEYELFKVAFQMPEEIHYDRQIGGGFSYLEQEQYNIATSMKFTSDLVKSVYFTNSEKNNDPYIVVGHSDVTIGSSQEEIDRGEYLVEVQYRLLSDLDNKGRIKI